MRKRQKQLLLNLIETFDEAHKSLEKLIKEKDMESAKILLIDCQKTAFQIIDVIKESEGTDCTAINAFNGYCSAVYEMFEILSEGRTDIDFGVLNKKLSEAKESVENINVRLEAVFLPYKASMWDSLESVWKAADADPNCDVYVVPIPYYDRNPDHTLGQFHYEGDEYPDYVPITDYKTYDISQRRPDMIYIHCPYDNRNKVMSIDSKYYSQELKKYTDMLVYIPYFVLNEIDYNDFYAIKGIEHFCGYPGVIYADKVILQSENMRRIYINFYLNGLGDTEKNRTYLENKFLGLGSPKYDRVMEMTGADIDIPEGWRKLIYKADGSRKKVIFYNTGLSPLLLNGIAYFEKIKRVFKKFKEQQNNVTLLWRPHPLTRSTITSMKPQFTEDYDRIVEEYISEGWGIYDDTSDMDRAVALSDGFYGDDSSIVQLFKKIGKPVMIQNLYI